MRLIKRQPQSWSRTLEQTLQALIRQPALSFSEMTPSQVPAQGGVYLISARSNGRDTPYYVGRTGNLRQRLYLNHLMGPLTNARLKKYLIDAKRCKSARDAKVFLKRRCNARWVPEANWRRRGALEGYVTAVLFPRYGIDREH